MKDTITLELSHIEITGMAVVLLWGDDLARIRFTSRVPAKNFRDVESLCANPCLHASELFPHVHDSGFGVQRILGAEDVLICKIYGGGDIAGGYGIAVQMIEKLEGGKNDN